MHIATEERAVLNLTRTLAASRERVFHARMEPEEIKRWFGPDACRVVETHVDLRVGGEFRFHLRESKQGEYRLRGEFREVTPPAKLVYTWQWRTIGLRGSRDAGDCRVHRSGRLDRSAPDARKSSQLPER